MYKKFKSIAILAISSSIIISASIACGSKKENQSEETPEKEVVESPQEVSKEIMEEMPTEQDSISD
ncbi:hypothetical protein [Algoriphagus marincola]|uniref:hypothetical protein n=1 Tax=Algoriphagus marincola TaxID=264027 RepID=UPI0004099B8F|nr:hypothetical protein [Algoriphagus marincola]